MISSVDSQVVAIEEYLGQIRSHRRRGITLAAQLMNGAEQLKHVGAFLPEELLHEHNDWRETWIQLRSRGCGEQALREFLPEDAAEVDMCQWERALKLGLEICQRRRVEQEQKRQQTLEYLQKILDLRSTGDPQPLTRLQERAQELKSRLLQGEFISTEDIQIYRVFWELVLDAREGRIDEPASLNRAVQINRAFDLLLTLQVVRGQIVPTVEQSGPANPRSRTTAVKPVRRLSVVPSSPAKAVETTPPRLEIAAPATDDRREQQALEDIRNFARKSSESAKQDAPEEEPGALATAQDCLAEAADYVLETLRELPAGQAAWKSHLRHGVLFFARGLAAVRSAGAGQVTDAPQSRQVLRWLQGLVEEPDSVVERQLMSMEPIDLQKLQQLKRELGEKLYELRRPRRINRILDRIQRRLATNIDGAEQNLERWQQVVADVDELVQDEQVAPCHRELHEVLAGSVDQMPTGLLESRSMRKVLAAIDRSVADREADEALRGSPELSHNVQRAAQLLAGRKVVIIGGAPRPRTHKWLQESLGLSELVWETIGEHEATLKFQEIVQAPGVAVVLILVRWVGHGHADDIRTYCLQVRRPYVTVVRGYCLEQLAEEILQQRGDELRVGNSL